VSFATTIRFFLPNLKFEFEDWKKIHRVKFWCGHELSIYSKIGIPRIGIQFWVPASFWYPNFGVPTSNLDLVPNFEYQVPTSNLSELGINYRGTNFILVPRFEQNQIPKTYQIPIINYAKAKIWSQQAKKGCGRSLSVWSVERSDLDSPSW
jgi:hypothetical protein